ncbi:hypothetical protein EOPP23_12405 [Endozoicomonas sp. OPT23]|nr:hypothetical protein [Endozoicomonas sp. OPT23]
MEVSTIEYLVLFFSLGLLMLMQIGFLCLESGQVRSKNSINVAAKNLLDLIVVILLFWAAGFSMIFGESTNSFIGPIKPLASSQDSAFLPLFFLFHAMFAATTATIVSGAMPNAVG